MAKTVRFPLKMRDDIEVRTMGELKENWDMEKIVGYFLDGKLTTWLAGRRYEREAAQVELLEKDDKALRQNLSAIFGIEYIANESTEEDMEAIQAQQERLNKLRQYTTDKEILDTVDCAAFDQDDLWDILDTGAKKVYLVNNTFEISLEDEEMTYIGVGKAIAKIDSKEPVDFEELGIRFENVKFDEKYIDCLKQSKNAADTQMNVSFCEKLRNRFEILSEFIYKLGKDREFMPHNVDFGDIFASSQKSEHFAYNDSIEKDSILDELTNKKVIIYSDVICYLRDLHFSYQGGMIFTQYGVVDYGMDSLQQWFYYPYQSIQTIHAGNEFLSIQVLTENQTVKMEEHEFKQDFSHRGWRARTIALFLQVVTGQKPTHPKDQAIVKHIGLKTLNGNSLFEYLK